MSSAAPSDLVARRPVWDALSTLFLDTDVSILRAYRSRVLAASPYSLPELEQILIDEVYPVCWANILAVAGEWAAFDPEWLEASILGRLHSPLGPLHRLHLGRLIVPIFPEWIRTKAAVAAARSGSGAESD